MFEHGFTPLGRGMGTRSNFRREGGGHPVKNSPFEDRKKNGEKSKKRVPRSNGEIAPPPPKGKT